jgi:hypothetical protein
MCSGNCNCSCKGEPGPRGIQGIAGPMGPPGADAGVSNVFEASLSLTSAEILLLFTSPITIVPSPGVGKYIEVISATSALTFVTTAYATSFSLILINTGATNYQMVVSSLLATVSSTYKFIGSNFTPTTATQIIENTALNVSVLTVNPTNGDGTVKIKVLYRIVTL